MSDPKSPSPPRLDRRQVFALAAAGGATVAGASSTAQAAVATFQHGVASGDPLTTRVMIWTRATPAAGWRGALPLRWIVAEDAALSRVVAQGRITTDAARDYTVKVDVDGLKPGRDYWYAFEGGVRSPVGHTRTLPEGRVERLALAFVTCALHPNGYFNAYDHISRAEQLDAVVELGDYIYEYGAAEDDFGMENGRKLGRIPEPAHDLTTLADYRTRYAQYRRDPDLQAAHARAPWICVWDDHEVCNDTWRGGAENHHDKTQGSFDVRRDAAMRAYFEWMPIREPQPGRPPEEIYRSFDFGDLASLTMVETRLTARSYQLEYDRPGDIPFIVYDASDPANRKPVRDAALSAKVKAEAAQNGGKPPAPYVLGPDVEAIEAYVADASRTMMGPVQEAWLHQTLTRSMGAGRPWQLIGNEVVMGRARSPKFAEVIGAERLAALLAAMPPGRREAAQRFVDIASYDQPFDLDGWDGYPAARARFDHMLQALGGGNVLVVSGDSHAFWANRLQPQGGGAPLAIEFGTSAITSPSIGDEAGMQIGPVFMAQNREIAFCDQLAKGYVRLELTREAATARMIAVEIDRKPYQARELAVWRVAATAGPGVGELQKL